jgi:hypothetical protein
MSKADAGHVDFFYHLSINNASKGFLVRFIMGGFGFVTLIQTQNVKIWSDSLPPQRFRAATSTGTALSTFPESLTKFF